MHPERRRRRSLILAAGLSGLIAGCAAQYGLSYLIPTLRGEGLDLATATFLVTAPIAGVLAALIAWGAAADRYGERRTMAIGLAGGALALAAAAAEPTIPVRWLFLFLAGALSAAIHAASGRLILGWFGPLERGRAMGVRQMGQPIGVAVSALAIPALATGGASQALLALAGACLAAAVVIAVVVRDPVRPAERGAAGGDGSPYRTPYLWRIHAASAMLVVPQFAVTVFAFDFLVTALSWPAAVAGAALAICQLVGAASRLGAGWWSDRVGNRLRPMRLVALVIGSVMVSLAVLGVVGSPVAAGALILAVVVTVAPNGLAYTAVAERAGPTWAGRALGIQNTFQNLVGFVVATPLAALIAASGGGATGYGIAFATIAALPFLAAISLPAAQEESLR